MVRIHAGQPFRENSKVLPAAADVFICLDSGSRSETRTSPRVMLPANRKAKATMSMLRLAMAKLLASASELAAVG